MNKDKLREELAEDEGCKFEIYLDHLGLPTFGIGHLVVEGDPEHGQPVGTPVDNERGTTSVRFGHRVYARRMSCAVSRL